MASRKRIFNIDHNCFYDLGVIALGISNCAITWVEQGVSVRCLTKEERSEAEFQQSALRARQAEAAHPLARVEVSGLKFERPKTTKYQRPTEAYDGIDTMPLVQLLNKCRWPRAA